MYRKPVLAITLTAVLLAAAPAAAGTVSGRLDRTGYTVIAVARNGKVVSTRANPAFRLRAPNGTYTLHLRNARGAYAGPVVLGGSAKHVILGLRGTARLGRIRVARGFGRTVRAYRGRSLVRTTTARARSGRPLGAGNFGAVRAPVARLAQVGDAAPGADPDTDGVPSALDVDDDGNGVLDNLQTAAPDSASARQATVFNALVLDLASSLNANAGAVTSAAIDRALKDQLFETFILPDGPAVLDCGGLSYCSAGGTGTIKAFGDPTSHVPFPSCCDADHPGRGTITPTVGGNAFVLAPGATSEQIGSGDTYLETFSDGTQVAGTLNYIFQTTPAIVAYSDGTQQGTISYPVAPGSPGTGVEHPLDLAAGPDGHVVAHLTFWRPQRRGIPGTGNGDFVDMGGLVYDVTMNNAPFSRSGQSAPQSPPQKGPGECPPGTYSATSASLNPVETDPVVGFGFLRDTATDRPPDPANTLGFSIDLTACLAAAAETWDVGQLLTLTVQAKDATFDHANQFVMLRRVS